MIDQRSSNVPTILIIARPGQFRDSLNVLAGSIFGEEATYLAEDVRNALNGSFTDPPAVVLVSIENEEVMQGSLTAIKRTWPATRIVLLVANGREIQAKESDVADAVLIKGTRAAKLLQYLEEVLSG